MRGLAMSAGIMSMVIGITFVARMYGPTEDGLKEWGYLAVFWGALLFFVTLQRLNKLFVIIISAFGIFLHGPPFFLWIIFHGSSITDGPSAFQAHWAFSLPYFYILAVCLFTIGNWRSSKKTKLY